MRSILFIIAAYCVFPAIARGDGGTVRLSERQGAYQITVFTSPTPVRAGPVDISVFVQDSASGEMASDVRVEVRIAPIDHPEDARTQPATAAAATNKLFRSAIFDLPSPGRWLVEVTIDGRAGPAAARFELNAGEPLPHWLALWPWIGWPAIAIVLFGVHQFLVYRKEAMSQSRTLCVPLALPIGLITLR